jgi:hippurate hydrolase
MFQPGDEGYHGARFMLEEGLDGGGTAPAGSFALHGGARYPAGVVGTRPGPILASGDTIQVVIHGRGGHASAPHDCLDPIPSRARSSRRSRPSSPGGSTPSTRR